jgi:hypothetical protein
MQLNTAPTASHEGTKGGRYLGAAVHDLACAVGPRGLRRRLHPVPELELLRGLRGGHRCLREER